MNIKELLTNTTEYPRGIYDHHFNLLKCPRIYCKKNKEGIEKFNEIYECLYSFFTTNCDTPKETIMTPSGGVSINNREINPITGQTNFAYNKCSYKVISSTKTSTKILFILSYNVFLLCTDISVKEGALSGYRAFKEFKKLCDNKNISLEPYSVSKEECKEIKKQIPKYKIEIESKALANGIGLGKPIPHCYHMDRHSSFGSGLAETHKEFEPVIQELYNLRYTGKKHTVNGVEIKPKDYYKSVMTNMIGYMQSVKDFKHRDFYPILARDSIQSNNDWINRELTNLRKQGYIPLLTNTDGIWYHKPEYISEPYHDDEEGEGIGHWSTEYADATMRIYSKGKYDFKYIEDGIEQYKPVVRGHTDMEYIYGPRNTWTWEQDILRYIGELVKYQFIDGTGIITIEDEGIL